MNDISALLSTVLQKFGIPFDSYEVEVFHSGHINFTYKVDTLFQGKSQSYVVQRINTYVFTNPVGVMHNIDLVTSHIRKRLIAAGKDPTRRVLEFLKRKNGKNYVFDDDEGFWRIYHYISDSITYDKVDDLNVLASAGSAFGDFQFLLSDFPMDSLIETMPNFHNTEIRMRNFFSACERNEAGRRSEIENEIRILRENEEIWSKLGKMKDSGKLPVRVTHNDTKYNNVLIDKTNGQAICVIDLDTVIPGLCAYDFGDAIRFCANDAAEDEKDTSLVGLSLEKYAAFASGFISSCAKFCSPEEIDSLALGALTMAFELSARFLEDYLNGDKYFKISHAEHNLERGRSQLALALDMKKKFDQMQAINKECAALRVKGTKV